MLRLVFDLDIKEKRVFGGVIIEIETCPKGSKVLGAM